MRSHWLMPFPILCCIGLLCILTSSAARAQDQPVETGWDLLETDPAATNFMGVPFRGVPLGNFNFGGSIGAQGTGLADTIVQRLSDATFTGSDPNTASPTSASIVALQLESVNPTDFGLGTDFYYLTLQSARGGPATTGNLTITSTTTMGGTFDSFFDVFFDLRKGALNGPIAVSSDLTLNSTGSPWSVTPPPSAILISGVNNQPLDPDMNSDANQDRLFFPGATTEAHPGTGQHTVDLAPVPEPAFFQMGALLGLGMLKYFCRKRSA